MVLEILVQILHFFFQTLYKLFTTHSLNAVTKVRAIFLRFFFFFLH